MKIEITIKYLAHSGSLQLFEEKINHLPSIGTSIVNNSLKDSNCCGHFVIISSECTIEENMTYYELVAFEINQNIYNANLDEFIKAFA